MSHLFWPGNVRSLYQFFANWSIIYMCLDLESVNGNCMSHWIILKFISYRLACLLHSLVLSIEHCSLLWASRQNRLHSLLIQICNQWSNCQNIYQIRDMSKPTSLTLQYLKALQKHLYVLDNNSSNQQFSKSL